VCLVRCPRERPGRPTESDRHLDEPREPPEHDPRRSDRDPSGRPCGADGRDGVRDQYRDSVRRPEKAEEREDARRGNEVAAASPMIDHRPSEETAGREGQERGPQVRHDL
jgi:hypothetical protein